MKAFGIASLVFAITEIFIPVIGYFLSGLSGVLSFFSARKGTTLGLWCGGWGARYPRLPDYAIF
jgi:hypothetical protein